MTGKSVMNDMMLCLESERLKTFTEWPNDPNWFCTPEKLANAGFFFNPSPDCLDNVCCAFCMKELDGWEPEDDPMSEHKRHSSKCPFLKLKKPFQKLTLVESLKFLNKVCIFFSDQAFNKQMDNFTTEAEKAREKIVSVFGKEC